MKTKIFIVVLYVAMAIIMFGIGLPGMIIAEPQVTCQTRALVPITNWEYTMAIFQMGAGGCMLLTTLAIISLIHSTLKRFIVVMVITGIFTTAAVVWAIVGAISLWQYDMRDCREALTSIWIMTHVMIIESFLLPLFPIAMILYKIVHIELE